MLVHSCKLKDKTEEELDDEGNVVSCMTKIQDCNSVNDPDEAFCGPASVIGEYEPCFKGNAKKECEATCAFLTHGIEMGDDDDDRCLFDREISMKMDYFKRERGRVVERSNVCRNGRIMQSGSDKDRNFVGVG